MEDTIKDGFLNGMEPARFFVLYVWALVGALLKFWRTTDKQIRTDARTSNKFEWRYFWKGVKRTVTTMVLIAVAIIYWDPEVSQFLFSQPVALKGWSSFLIVGAGSDVITETVFGEAENGLNYFKKKLNGGGK